MACTSGKNVSMQVVSMRIPKKPCGSWVLQVYWGPGYAHLRGHVNNGLNVVSADRRVGKIIPVVIEVMHGVLNVKVGLQEPMKGIG